MIAAPMSTPYMESLDRIQGLACLHAEKVASDRSRLPNQCVHNQKHCKFCKLGGYQFREFVYLHLLELDKASRTFANSTLTSEEAPRSDSGVGGGAAR